MKSIFCILFMFSYFVPNVYAQEQGAYSPCNMWWKYLLSAGVGGLLAIIGRLLGDRYHAKIEHKRWIREKQAQTAEKALEVYNELTTYLSFGDKDLQLLDLISKIDFGQLLTNSRRISSRIPLYFGDRIQGIWVDLVMMLERTSNKKFLLEFEKMVKGEEPSKEIEDFYNKVEEFCVLLKKELGLKT